MKEYKINERNCYNNEADIVVIYGMNYLKTV